MNDITREKKLPLDMPFKYTCSCCNKKVKARTNITGEYICPVCGAKDTVRTVAAKMCEPVHSQIYRAVLCMVAILEGLATLGTYIFMDEVNVVQCAVYFSFCCFSVWAAIAIQGGRAWPRYANAVMMVVGWIVLFATNQQSLACDLVVAVNVVMVASLFSPRCNSWIAIKSFVRDTTTKANGQPLEFA